MACDKVSDLDLNSTKALLMRAKDYLVTEQYENAYVEDIKKMRTRFTTFDRHSGATEAEQKDLEQNFNEVSLVRKLIVLKFLLFRLTRPVTRFRAWISTPPRPCSSGLRATW